MVVSESVLEDIRKAQQLGVASLATWIILLGPLAVLMAVPAIVRGRRAMAAFRAGRADQYAIRGVKTGLTCAWISVALFAVLIFAVMINSAI